MNLLIDTRAVVWSLLKLGKLSAKAHQAIENDDNGVMVSVASVWEIAIKVGLSRWPEAQPLMRDFEGACAAAGFALLPSQFHSSALRASWSRCFAIHSTDFWRRRQASRA